jgi:hypothetical protein
VKELKLFLDPYGKLKNKTWKYNSKSFPMNSIQSGQFITKIKDKYYNLLICDNDLVYIQGPIGDSKSSKKYTRIYDELPNRDSEYCFIVRDCLKLYEKSMDKKSLSLMIKYGTLKKKPKKRFFSKKKVVKRGKEKNSSGNPFL